MTKSGLSAHTLSSDWNVKALIQIATETPLHIAMYKAVEQCMLGVCLWCQCACCRVKKGAQTLVRWQAESLYIQSSLVNKMWLWAKNGQPTLAKDYRCHPKLCTHCEEIWSLNHPYWPTEIFPAAEILGNYRLSVTASHANRRLTCECCFNTSAVGRMWCAELTAPQCKV